MTPAAARHGEIRTVDPEEFSDWDAQMARHPESTVFHGSGWARVLREVYGHRPCYVARMEGRQLTGLLPVMEVTSWLTGRRGVSLPFTDFCPALQAADCDQRELYESAMEQGRQRRWSKLECRGLDGHWEGAQPSLSFYTHTIDLTAGPEQLFERMEPSARRGARKAERAGLTIDFDSGEQSMRAFFRLHCGTRRRHGLPPQPWRFFLKIQQRLLSLGQGFIATARSAGRPVAAVIVLHNGRQALYKFGASDFASQRLRPNNLVIWAAIKRCAERGLSALNLGRTSLSNEGLRRFKLGLGAREQEIKYAKYDFSTKRFVRDIDLTEGWFNRVFARLPLPVLRLAGAVMYPHLS